MVEQRVDGHLVAVQDVEDAVGQPGLLPQLGHRRDRRGVLLARLEDDGVAAGDGDGEEPHRHHGREVERGDDRDHAQRLADRVDVDLGRDVLGEPALEGGDAAGELDDLQAAGHLAEGVGEDLAVLRGDDRGELVRVVEQLAEPEEHGVRLVSEVAPQGEAAGGRGDGGVDLLGCGEGDRAGHLAGGGVGDGAGPVAGALTPGAVDPVRDGRGHGCLSGDQVLVVRSGGSVSQMGYGDGMRRSKAESGANRQFGARRSGRWRGRPAGRWPSSGRRPRPCGTPRAASATVHGLGVAPAGDVDEGRCSSVT